MSNTLYSWKDVRKHTKFDSTKHKQKLYFYNPFSSDTAVHIPVSTLTPLPSKRAVGVVILVSLGHTTESFQRRRRQRSITSLYNPHAEGPPNPVQRLSALKQQHVSAVQATREQHLADNMTETKGRCFAKISSCKRFPITQECFVVGSIAVLQRSFRWFVNFTLLCTIPTRLFCFMAWFFVSLYCVFGKASKEHPLDNHFFILTITSVNFMHLNVYSLS